MARLHRSRLLIIGLLTLTLMASSILFCSSPLSETGYPQSSQFKGGKFRNEQPALQHGFLRSVGIMWRFLTQRPEGTFPEGPLEVLPLDRKTLETAPDKSLWRLGHSTILLKIDGKFWLTDPVFCERASPVSLWGPKRFHPPVIALEELPEIEAVIISHDHYDHLDKEAVVALEAKVRHYVTPLGVGERLIDWGIPAAKVQQFDWWQETQLGAMRLVAAPAKHFSGRSVMDRDRTLWSSWVLLGPEMRIFFSGDSGYFDGFKRIGERFGPFDLTLMEAGAYNKDWPGVHMHPEETVQAHLDVGGRCLLPIHNGTFDLSMHRWTDPFERIAGIAAAKRLPLSTPRMGERVDLRKPEAASIAWWKAESARGEKMQAAAK